MSVVRESRPNMDNASSSPDFSARERNAQMEKNAVSDLRTISISFFFEQPLFFLRSPPSQPRVEHEESSIVSLLKQAAAMAVRGEGGGGGSVYIPQPPPLLLPSASATLLLPFPLRGADRPCLLVSSLNKRRDTWSCALEAVRGKPWRVRRLYGEMRKETETV